MFIPAQDSFATTEAAQTVIWLLGQPPLDEYLDFVARFVVDGADIRRSRLVAAWRRAHDHFARLEKREAGEADRVERFPLPPELRRHAARLRASRNFRNTFDVVRTTIEMVELDRLIVWQAQVEDRFALDRAADLHPGADPAQLFDFCLPARRAAPPVTVNRIAGGHFQLVSQAADLAMLRARVLDPATVPPGDEEGPLAGMIGLPFGFGANMMSVISSERRLVLHNGYHRAYALRALGHRHVPCVVQHVTRRDELNLVADTKVAYNPGYYFRGPRPPLLKDFFDPAVTTRMSLRPTQTVVDLKISISSHYVPR
ncbi:MAG: hypothetical protein JSS36_02880 [Proteobacteria bacterium]|nr:hypothetical protein [Pseudomonadota bacterium]